LIIIEGIHIRGTLIMGMGIEIWDNSDRKNYKDTYILIISKHLQGRALNLD
jgi:hypothetical protein